MNKVLVNAIIGVLRRIGYRNIHRKRTEERVKVARGQYRCEKCEGIFKRPEIHLDHINPVIDPDKGFVDWNTYIERLFLGDLQALCVPCHKEKTLKENDVRRAKRNQESDKSWEEIE